jgi:hypothetical protein
MKFKYEREFDEDIESIEDLDADTMMHIFYDTRDCIDALYILPTEKAAALPFGLGPAGVSEEKQIDYNLRTLAHSIKKSLMSIYPAHKEEISSINDAEGAKGLESYYRCRYPFHEGAQALSSIYSILSAYKYYFPANEKEYLFSRLLEMERVISDYKMHALDTMRKKQDRKSERRKELGRRSGYKKGNWGIRQAIIDHYRYPHLCEVCKGEPIELSAQAFISRFKAKHSCSINNLTDFDEEEIHRKAYLTQHDHYVFYNSYTGNMCQYKEAEGIKEIKLSTLPNIITWIRAEYKKRNIHEDLPS